MGRANGKNGCPQKYIPAPAIEQAVQQQYDDFEVNEVTLATLEALVHEGFALLRQSDEDILNGQRRQIAKTDRRLKKLLELHYDDSIDPDLFKAEQQRLRADKSQAQAQLAAASTQATDLAEQVDRAIDLIRHADKTYSNASNTGRRQLNAELFETFIVTDDKVEAVRTDVYQALTAPDLIPALQAEITDLTQTSDGEPKKPQKAKNRIANRGRCGSRIREEYGNWWS